MNYKQIASLLAALLGLICVGLSLNEIRMSKHAAIELEEAQSPFFQNPVGKLVAKSIEKKARQPKKKPFLLLAVGIVAFAAGGGAIFFFRES